MTERLVIKCAYGHRAEAGEAAYAELQAEVQASRKLVADLLALHHQHAPVAHFIYPYCRACQHPYPCPTVQLIEASGCSAET